MANQRITVGPWGGTGGDAWDDGSYAGVQKIQLAYGDAIDFFRAFYVDSDGKLIPGSPHPPKNTPNPVTEIQLKLPEEYIQSVNGFYSSSGSGTTTPVIRSLTFKTNKKTFGPYGVEEGTSFSIPLENSLIVGFKGRSGAHLEAIGVHLAPLPP